MELCQTVRIADEVQTLYEPITMTRYAYTTRSDAGLTVKPNVVTLCCDFIVYVWYECIYMYISDRETTGMNYLETDSR